MRTKKFGDKLGDIKRMLDPKTIALIGATEREGSVGRAIIDNLLLLKNRKILPVNLNSQPGGVSKATLVLK